MKLWTVEISAPRGFRYLRVKAHTESAANIIAARKIWPARGEYIKSIKEYELCKVQNIATA
jgi:hypothetical protein